jgi:ATP/maltotriose-dependent transcriptional regulator MalT
VARAWSELAAVELVAALETIGCIEAECMPLSMAQAGLQCALLQAMSAALQDDTEAAARLVENALATYEGAAAHPATAFLLRLGHWKARRLDAFSRLSGAVSHVPGHRRDALWSILHLAMEATVEAEQLRLASAVRLANEAMQLSTHFHGAHFAGSRVVATVSARLLYEQNEVDAAERLIRDRLGQSGSHGGIEGALGAYILGARIAAARGQLPFAILLLREAQLLGEDRGWPRLTAASLAEHVRLLLVIGRVVEAEACTARLAQGARNSAGAINDCFVARYLAISRARVELAQGRASQAVSSLQEIAQESLQRRECHVAVEATLLLACALHADGREHEAAAEGMRAVAQGAAAGLYRTFLDGGEATGCLLRWVYERRDSEADLLGPLRPYVRNLLMGFRERPVQPEGARARHRSGDSLSPRERHIVQLMSHGLSNKRIARQLSIAPETVKSHAKHILLKLAAQTRVEAVSRALSLGMI